MSLKLADESRNIARNILIVRGQRVLLDEQLAALYCVSTKALNQAVRRNRARFPEDFMLQLTAAEWAALRSQFVTLEKGRGRHRKYLPYAFTEHGAIMAATVINSQRAVQMSLYVVRAFVKLREAFASNALLAEKLERLERSVVLLDAKTRREFQEVYTAIRALTNLPEPHKRSIGFTADLSDGER